VRRPSSREETNADAGVVVNLVFVTARQENSMYRILRLATVLLFAFGAVGVAAAPASASGEIPRQNTAVMLINRQTAKCATVAGGVSTDNNVPLVQYNCDAHASRRWVFVTVDYYHWWIKNVQTGKCMTLAGGVSTANNVELVQYTCDSHPSRLWYPEYDVNTGSWRLWNFQSIKCATVAGGVSTANNVPLVQYACDTHPSRSWYIA
jgi:cytolethal distending toxin subunit A